VDTPKNRVLLLAILMISISSMADATQVQNVTFGSGGRGVAGGSSGADLTIGQSLIGSTGQGTGEHQAELGLWTILFSSYLLTPVSEEIQPPSYQLLRNYPNPFNPSTRIGYNLSEETEVVIEVYDLKGRRVETLLKETRPAGRYTITYEPKNLASGVYLVLMRAGSYRAAQRMTLVK